MRPSFVRKPAVPALGLAVLAAVLFGPLTARADDGGNAVARISLIHGSVAVGRGDSSTPVAAALNAPVLGADYVTTGDDARAEVQFDSPTMVRLGANVQMRFTRIDTGVRTMQLAQGTIELRLLRGTDGTSNIDTPSISIRPRQAGIYRVTVTQDGVTQATVRAGAAQIVTPQGDRMLEPGQTLIAQGEASSPILRMVDAIAYDDFDRFNKDRDDRHERALAASGYTGPSLQGIDDLDAYGRWVTDGSYGNVWVPSNVAPGWAPYRDGRWTWEDRFGWTWIGAEPWGWAPYHYGRWYHSPHYGWCWYPPGQLVPVWQPALVGFFTFGGGFSGGFGSIGWVPLAPFEPFNPWWGYGYGPTVVNNVTIVNNNNAGNGGHDARRGDGDGLVHHMYKNAEFGATAVPGERFILGKFDHPAKVPPSQLRHIEIVRGAVPVVPTVANLRFSDAPVAAQLAGQRVPQPHAFAGSAVAMKRVPFDQQRDAVAAVAAQVRAAQPHLATQPAARALAEPQAVTGKTAVASPWQRFGASRTPVVIDGSTVRSDGAAAKASDVTPRAAAAQPRGVAPAADPWKRFDTQRGTTTTPAVHAAQPAVRTDYGGTTRATEYVAPVHQAPAVRTQPAPEYRAAPPRAQPEYHAPPAAAAPPPPAQTRHTESHAEHHTSSRPPG